MEQPEVKLCVVCWEDGTAARAYCSCDECYAAIEREEARRQSYNQHLGSKQWLKTKKALRSESVREYGRAVCSRCGMIEHDNKREYGEGLHGHHTTYERFGQEKPEDVQLLCTRCHAWEHGKPAPKSIRDYKNERIGKLSQG